MPITQMWSYKHYKIHCYFANITVFHTACRKTVIDDLISVVPYKIVFWIPKTICDDITKNEKMVLFWNYSQHLEADHYFHNVGNVCFSQWCWIIALFYLLVLYFHLTLNHNDNLDLLSSALFIKFQHNTKGFNTEGFYKVLEVNMIRNHVMLYI